MIARLLAELKRRRVFRVAGVYAVVGWIVIQVAGEVAPALLLPEWVVRAMVLVVLLGFPIAIVLAWAFDVTPDGVKRAASAALSESGDRGARAGSGENGPAERSGPAKGAPAAWVGLGIVVAIATLGAYATLAPGSDGAPAERSIAVLPFDNLSPDPDNAFFAAGVHEDVLTQLTLIEDLTVISRTSVLPYAEAEKGVRQIGRELGASYILEGSVRRAGDRVRVVAQLVDAANDEHLWAQQYDRDLTDLFAVQSELAREIADAMRAALSPKEEERIAGRPTDNVAAYDLYLRAREILRSGRLDAAIELLRQAVALDTTFADAYAELAQAYVRDVQGYGRSVVWHDSAEVLARRAIRLAPGRAEPHHVLGSLLEQDGRYTEAIRHLRTTLEISPGHVEALRSLAILERARGRHDVALRHFARVRRLSPNDLNALWNTGITWYLLGDTDRALRWLAAADSAAGGPYAWGLLGRAAVQLSAGASPERVREQARALASDYPGNATTVMGAAELLADVGELDEATRLAESVYRQAPDTRFFGRTGSLRGLLGRLLIASGEAERGRELIERQVAILEAEVAAGSESPYLRREMGELHAALGHTTQALHWFEAAFEAGERALVDPLRGTGGAANAAPRPDVYGHPAFRRLAARAAEDLGEMRDRAIAAEKDLEP